MCSIATMLVTLYVTVTMKAARLIFALAMCFLCVSSDDEHYFKDSCDLDFCATHTLNAALGSSVLLQCIFKTNPNPNSSVSWAYIPDTALVILTPKGRIKFEDPRDGRVKVFPNQASEGNYSICIDELKPSDLGCYRCTQGQDCFQVELVEEEGTQSGEVLLLIYICVGVAAFVLLIVGSYCCMKVWCNNRTEDNTDNPVGSGASAPPGEPGRAPVDEQERGEDNLVYENDDQCPASQQGAPSRAHSSQPAALPEPTQSSRGLYPNLSQFNLTRMESQRTKQRFHTELFSRLRQASFGRQYYVNQREINRQQAASAQAENHRRAGGGRNKAKDNCEYQNPIYNRSTDHLNRM